VIHDVLYTLSKCWDHAYLKYVLHNTQYSQGKGYMMAHVFDNHTQVELLFDPAYKVPEHRTRRYRDRRDVYWMPWDFTMSVGDHHVQVIRGLEDKLKYWCQHFGFTAPAGVIQHIFSICVRVIQPRGGFPVAEALCQHIMLNMPGFHCFLEVDKAHTRRHVFQVLAAIGWHARARPEVLQIPQDMAH